VLYWGARSCSARCCISARSTTAKSRREKAIGGLPQYDSIEAMIAKMDEAGVEKVFITQCKMWSYHNKSMYYMDTKLEEVAQYTRRYPDRFVGLAALGGGCELALAVDFRIASETARFGLPEIKIGAFPGGGGTQRLSRLIGVAKAKEMILTGEPITAQQALASGLVMMVVEKGKLMESARQLAEKLAALPRLALQASQMLINRSPEVDLTTGREFEARTFGGIAQTHDLTEGTKAFLEKRKPNFTGN